MNKLHCKYLSGNSSEAFLEEVPRTLGVAHGKFAAVTVNNYKFINMMRGKRMTWLRHRP